MIYIEDYRSLPAVSAALGFPELPCLLGETAAVRTAAGGYTGVVVGEDAATLTLACKHRSRGKTAYRRVVISKRHIIAIETRLN